MWRHCNINLTNKLEQTTTGLVIKGLLFAVLSVVSVTLFAAPANAAPGTGDITVKVFSNKTASQLPSDKNIQVTLTAQGGLVPQDMNSVARSVALKFDNEYTVGQATFTNANPGQYKLCITPPSIFSFEQCKTVNKVSGTVLNVSFGSSRVVNVTVAITMSSSSLKGTYGPINLTFNGKTASGVEMKKTAIINASSITASDSPSTPINLTTALEPVDPGSYKVCVTGTSFCSSVFQKIADKRSDVTIVIGATDSDTYFTALGSAKTSCAIDGIGWIICPVMNFMAKIVDGAYSIVGKLLTTPSINTSGKNADGSDNGTYTAWQIMRTIANIAFVIAFLIIIFSQLTSIGVTNYGIKKVLPRLVIAAILVNLSYFICAIAVDISNILGNSMKQVFDGILGQITIPDSENGWKSGGTWGAIVPAVLAGGVLLYVSMAVLLPALVGALFAIVTVFLVLTLRQALIILLIIISPLAFVAFLLPNTESWFKKWRELLTTLLLMFPIIAIIFGASALASKVIMASSPDMPVQIMGALMAIIPLAITPIVMKTAGGVLNRFGGIINNPNKGPFDRLKKGAGAFGKDYDNMRSRRALQNNPQFQFGRGAFTRWGARRKAYHAGRETELNRANAEYVANESQRNEAFRNQVAGGSAIFGEPMRSAGEAANMRALAGAINVTADLTNKEVMAAGAVIDHLNLSAGQKKELAKGEDVIDAVTKKVILSGKDDNIREAAIKSAVQVGTVKDVEEIIISSDKEDTDRGLKKMNMRHRQALVKSMISNGIPGKALHLGGQTLGEIEQGTLNSYNAIDPNTGVGAVDAVTGEKIMTQRDIKDGLDAAVARAVADGKYSPESIVAQDAGSLERIQEVLTHTTRVNRLSEKQIDPAAMFTIREQFKTVATHPRISERTTEAQRKHIDFLRHP